MARRSSPSNRALEPACRAAENAGLWGPALLLARHAGEPAFQETAALMAQRTINGGAPLRAMLLLLAGAPDAVHAPSVPRPQPGAFDCVGVQQLEDEATPIFL